MDDATLQKSESGWRAERRKLRCAANIFGFVYALLFARISINDFMRMPEGLEGIFAWIQFLFIPFFWVWLYEKRSELPKPRPRFLGLTAFVIFAVTYFVAVNIVVLPQTFPPRPYSIDR